MKNPSKIVTVGSYVVITPADAVCECYFCLILGYYKNTLNYKQKFGVLWVMFVGEQQKYLKRFLTQILTPKNILTVRKLVNAQK